MALDLQQRAAQYDSWRDNSQPEVENGSIKPPSFFLPSLFVKGRKNESYFESKNKEKTLLFKPIKNGRITTGLVSDKPTSERGNRGYIMICEECERKAEANWGDGDTVLCEWCYRAEKEKSKKSSIADIEQGLLVECDSCHKTYSRRAKKCPKCGNILKQKCCICKTDIPIDSVDCPECGDPAPFTGEHIKEQKTNDQTALTSYYSKQKSEHPVTTKNSRPSNFSLSWFLFSFDGRIGRQAFWCAYPVFIFLGLILSVAIELFTESRNMNGFMISAILTLLLLWPSLAIQVKRWHDRNKSANWIILNMIPVIGSLWVTIELGFLKGTEGNNDYGNDPLSN